MIDVLIIDDDPVFGELMVDRLGAAGLRASFHHGWFQSLIRVREEQPKLLIIDVNMPAMSGTKLMDTLRTNLAGRMPPVLLMSSMDPKDLTALGEASGATAVLSKSANRALLLSTVRRLLPRG